MGRGSVSYPSSPESNDSAVETLVSQAIDLCALEQIAALNTAHLSDSVLPPDLESRFHKLKSFPGPRPKSNDRPPCPDREKEEIPKQLQKSSLPSSPGKGSETKFGSRPPSTESMERNERGKDAEVPSPAKMMNEYKGPKAGTHALPPLDPSSPPRQTCCFWLSPKKTPRKKSKEDANTSLDFGSGDWALNDEILSDFSTFSLKDQRRKLKKALKEQEKVSREAEKMVKWVKQASARFESSTASDSLSDDEIFK